MDVFRYRSQVRRTRASSVATVSSLYSLCVAYHCGFRDWLYRASVGDAIVAVESRSLYFLLLSNSRFSYLTVVHSWTGRVVRAEYSRLTVNRGVSYHDLEVFLMGLSKRFQQSQTGVGGSLAGPSDALGGCFPTLTSMMNERRWEDGSPRQVSTLTLFFDDGFLKGSLNDRDSGRVLWASALDLDALLQSLEGMLADANAPWREGGKRKKSPRDS